MIVTGRVGHKWVMVKPAPARSEAALDSLPEPPPSAIETLLNAHFAFIWRVLRRMGLRPADADDATQQVFMIASTKLDRIAPDRERAFLYGIALRVASHARRTQRRRREAPIDQDHLDQVPEPTESASAPDTQLSLRQAWDLLDELLAKLPEKLSRVLVLAEVEQLEVSEIASLEGIPLGTAASRLRLGRARFRTLLTRHAERNPFRGES